VTQSLVRRELDEHDGGERIPERLAAARCRERRGFQRSCDLRGDPAESATQQGIGPACLASRVVRRRGFEPERGRSRGCDCEIRPQNPIAGEVEVARTADEEAGDHGHHNGDRRQQRGL
jgi:hypothetical protein